MSDRGQQAEELDRVTADSSEISLPLSPGRRAGQVVHEGAHCVEDLALLNRSELEEMSLAV